MRNSLFKTALSLLLSSVAIFSEEYRQFSSAEAVEWALRENHSIVSMNYRILSAKADLRAASNARLPVLSVGASSAFTNRTTPFSDRRDRHSIHAELRQPIFTGFALSHERELSEIKLLLEEQRLEAGRQRIAYTVEKLYWNLIALEEARRIASESTSELEAFAAAQQLSFDQGLLFSYDMDIISASVAQSKLEEHSLSDSYESMMQQFTTLLGLPVGTAVELTDSLFSQEPNFNGDYRPDLREMELQAHLAAVGSKLARSALYPSLMAAGSYNNSNPDYLNRDRWGDSWNLSLNLSFTLWDWRRRALSVESAEMMALASSSAVEEYELRVTGEIADARRAVNRAEEHLRISQTLLSARKTAFASAEARYNSGEITLHELLSVQNSFHSARYSELQSRVDLALAVLNNRMYGIGSSR